MSNSSLFNFAASILRDQAAVLAAERVQEQIRIERDRIRDQEAEEALADAPDDWQAPLSPEDINRLAAIQDEILTEGRTIRHRFNFKE